MASTSKGTVYVYFTDGLNDIYREIYIELSEKVLSTGVEKRESHSKPVERIVSLAEWCLLVDSNGSPLQLAGERYLERYPDFSSAQHVNNNKMQCEEDRLHYLEGLEKAGFPA